MEARINELETKLSFAEDQLDALNRIVYRQQQQIDQLLAAVRALHEQLAALAPAQGRSLRDEIPPHY